MTTSIFIPWRIKWLKKVGTPTASKNPACVHCTVNAHNKSAVPDYLADLQEAVDHVRAHPELKNEGEAAMYGLMAKVPVKGLVQHSVRKVMEGMYSPSGEVPDLSKVGEDDDDVVMSFINKYGDKAMGALEKLSPPKTNWWVLSITL